jgi:hypothetical protein
VQLPYHGVEWVVKGPAEEVGWSFFPREDGLFDLHQDEKPARSGFAEGNRCIHHVQWKHPSSSAPASGYRPPTTATSFKTGRFTGADFPLQPDGTLRCPAGQSLLAQERRREADGGLRMVYAASIRSCRPCLLREQCQWNGCETHKPEPA